MKFKIRLDSEHRLKYKSTAYKVFHFLGKFALLLFILILLIIGFTQTSYFRSILKDQVINFAQKELNGTISVQSIYGTLFSTITIKNLKIDYGETEIVSAKTLHVSINPLVLLKKQILINKIFVENLSLKAIQFSDSTWIFDKLLKHPSKPDTLPVKKFNYKVLIKNINFSNCNFHLRRFIDSLSQISDAQVYQNLNLNDLRVEKLNLRLKANLNFIDNTYILVVNDFNFITNVNDLGVKRFYLDLKLADNSLLLKQFEIQTFRTNLSLVLNVNDLNPNDSTLLEKISEKKLAVVLTANRFDFNDLKNIIPPLDMLNGKVFVKLDVEGSLDELFVNELKVQLDSTKLNAIGVLRNILSGENLYMDVDLNECVILMKDVSSFLPNYSIPKFPSLGKVSLNGKYKGTPLRFESKIQLETSKGTLNGNAQLDLTRKIPTYRVQINTENLSLKPFTNIEGFVNSNLSLLGEGFDPTKINSKLTLRAENSRIENNNIDSLRLEIDAYKNLFSLDFVISSDTSSLQLTGLLNISNKTSPEYELSFNGRRLDLQQNFNLKDFTGLLNFEGNLKGKSFVIDDINAALNFSVFDSYINRTSIDKKNFYLLVDHSNQSNKTLTFNSDLIDVQIAGRYNFDEIAKSVTNVIRQLQKYIENKIQLFEGKLSDDSIKIVTTKHKVNNTHSKSKKGEKNQIEFSLSYRTEFKDLELINLFLKNSKINARGNISGDLEQKSSNLKFSLNTDLKDFWIVDREKSYRIKDAEFNSFFYFIEQTDQTFTLELSAKTRAKKVLLGSDIRDVDLNFNFYKDTLKYRIQSLIDSLLFIRSEGILDITQPDYRAQIQKATIEFKKYKLTNEGILNFAFNKDNIYFENFILRRKKERLKLEGKLDYAGKQNLNLLVENLELYDLALNFFPDIKEDIDGKISIKANLTGTSKTPILTSEINLNDFTYGSDRLGDLSGEIIYKEKKLTTSLKYVDEVFKRDNLSIQAEFPVDLSFESQSKEILNPKEKFFVKVIVNNFNLAPIRAFIPVFKGLEGSLNGEVNISGTLEKPVFYGSLISSETKFLLAQNNLKYQSDLSIKFNDDRIILDYLNLQNIETKKRGKLMVGGSIQVDSRGIKDLKFIARGNLLVLGNESRAANPNIYGDLFLEISSPIIVEGKYDNYSITGDVVIKETSLIIPPSEAAYNTERETFTYTYVNYAPEIDPVDLAFFKAEQELRSNKKVTTQKSDNFLTKVSARLKISLKNNVSLQLIFNRELNQRLFADLKGEVIYNISENQTSIQGKIELTQDSYLVLYQKFNASGSIRFENEISNPYLDVTATYSNYYLTGDTVNAKVKDVTIKLKLIGTVAELGKNLVSNRENIEIIIDGTVDGTKDASDAVAFILIGKFKDDLTAEDRASTAQTWGGTFQSAASSLLGSVITNFANSILGDVLRNVEFKKVGEETKFSLEGRIKEFRFKVGGGTDVFQNFALAHIQLEYPISEKLYLRLMRKQSQLQSTKPVEMINEIGLKYKVEF